MPRDDPDGGMILINVLAIVAVAATVVMLMINAEDPALDRAIALREASQALAVARGGELSAVAALRRDALLAPASDDRTEPWARVEQAKTAIDGGSFSLTIADAQDRFNVNAAGGTGEPILAAITEVLGLKPDIASRISATIADDGAVSDLRELERAGIDAPTIAALRPLVTALPGRTEVNVNSVGIVLLGALLGDPVGARILIDRRDRAGRLTPDDFLGTGLREPAGTGFTSDHYRVTTTVTIGATTQTLTSLLERRRSGEAVAVVALARTRGNAASPG